MKEYQICKRCVMDTTDPDIVFDKNGYCNHCIRYFEKSVKLIFKGEEGKKILNKIVGKIKNSGKDKEYDCIVGVSGGVDSTFTVYKAKELGLRPLAFHLDNGWDAELAVDNIEKFLKKLDIDLYTYVVNWDEFKDLHLSYLKASVVDIEVPTDHAIFAGLFKVANELGIKYIISGSNVVTEGIMPKAWAYSKLDLKNLMKIHKKFGHVELKTFPTIDAKKLLYYILFKKMRTINLLNYIDYNKEEAKRILIEKFGWRDYGGKHHESIFTKFYQNYILPTKFGIDKRKAHLSTLICSGQITREQALKELKRPLYEEDELKRDMEYVIKKLGISENEFEDLMKLPIKKHEYYGSGAWLYSFLSRLKNKFLTK